MNTQTGYFKKALVVLMAVIMVFTYMPSMAWADSDDSGTVATPKSCLAFEQDLEEGTHFYPYETGGKISLEVKLASYYYDANGNQQTLPADAKVAYALFKDRVRQSTIINPHFDIPIQESMAGQTMTFYIKAVTKIEGTLYEVDSKTYTVEIGPKPIDVTLSVGNQGTLASVGEKAAINLPVTVVDLNQDKQFSVDEAMVAAHITYLNESDYARRTEDGNVTVSKLWGTETANASFYINGTAATAAKTLTAGDTIYASAGTAGETYIYAAFSETERRVLPNETFTLTLTDNNDKPLSGVAIGTWEKGTFTALNEIITDEKGEVSLTLPKGSYLLSAKGKVNITENSADVATEHTIIAPFCKVECAMPGGNCGGLGGNEGNATWSYDVGTKKLTINGTGTIGGSWKNWANVIPPWEAYRNEIESIEIGEGITKIIQLLFRGSTRVNSILLPNTLQDVETGAFMDCKALTKISFAKDCKAKLGGSAFEGCTALTEVALPTGVTVQGRTFVGCTALAKATVTNVAESMFAGCTALKEVVYQEGAVTFGNSPFAGRSSGGIGYEACKTVEKVWIPETLTVWGNAFDDEMLGKITFDGPGKHNFFFAEDGSIYNKDKTEMYYAGSGALGTVIIPKTVTALKPYAFANRTELKKVIFEEGSILTEIAEHCFEGCTALKEVENLPSTLQDIKNSAFSGCSALSEIKLPDAVKTIGGNAFKDTSLQSIALPDGLQSLGGYAFMNCAKLTKLELPDKLTAFGSKVIQGTAVE